ncbi:MAG: DUF4124 domain-containing protein [Gammaproteobacteria bacterium]|nr:DUF4124 domain-containing protein [Gammaproteobacteria bacterium]
MAKRFELILFAVLAFSSANLSADIYKCTSANGEILYTDEPCSGTGGTQQKMQIDGGGIELSGSDRTEQAPPESQPPTPPFNNSFTPPESRFPEKAQPRKTVGNTVNFSRDFLKDAKGILIIALIVFPIAYFIHKLLFKLQLPVNRLFFAFLLSVAASVAAGIVFLEMYIGSNLSGQDTKTLELAKAGISGLAALIIIPIFAKKKLPAGER